jgi:FkbM family methyltransferase
LEVNRPDAVYFYYHYEPFGSYWDLIKERLIRVPVQRVDFVRKYRYADRYMRRFRYAHEADFVRLERLLAHGGVYADIDTIFVNPVPPELREKPFVMGREGSVFDPATNNSVPSVCNAYIMAERNAQFGQIWLEHVEGAFNGTWSNHSTLLPCRLSEQFPDLVHLEPSRTFYKHGSNRTGLRTLLEGCDVDYEGLVSMHLWAHLWWSRWRRDFSNFHAGLLTEEYINRVDTTYNLVARRFLPRAESNRRWRPRQPSQTEARPNEPLPGLRELGRKAYILGKLAAFAVVPSPLAPNNRVHRDYARRQWKNSYIRTRIRARNQFERWSIVDSVTMWDEYGIADETFTPSDVAIDVGAHVGSFTLLCHHLGSRRIYAYEPERENFRLLARHVRGLAGINLFNLAVFRSDRAMEAPLVHSGYLYSNTGAGTVLLGGRAWDVNTQVFVDDASFTKQRVTAVALDEILSGFERVKLLKLDCEGSEFPILLTSRLLARVERIAGEFHEVSPEIYAALDPRARIAGFAEYRVGSLISRLKQFGFDVYVKEMAPNIGFFRAVRSRCLAQAHRARD